MQDDALREKRLIFYRDDIDQTNKLLKEFIKLSGAKCVFLVDKEGHLVTQGGKNSAVNPDTLSALIAGSFAATTELARILGETEFSVLFHEGKKDHIHISLVGKHAILAILFDESTTIGMVRLYAKETIEKIEKIFQVASKKYANKQGSIDENFGSTAKDKVDDLFGE